MDCNCPKDKRTIKVVEGNVTCETVKEVCTLCGKVFDQKTDCV